MFKYIITFLIVIMLVSCHDGCKSGEYQCNGTNEEICADNDWITVTDCSKSFSLDPEAIWTCCESSDLYDGGPGCDYKKFCN